MNASIKTFAAYFNYIGSIELPEDVIRGCYHQGQCQYDIENCMELPEVKSELAEIDPAALIKELEQYGAWEASELQDHQINLQRILWIAAGDIQDSDEWQA